MTSLRENLKSWFLKKIRELLAYKRLTKEQKKYFDFLIESYFRIYGPN